MARMKSAWVVTWEWMGDHARVEEQKRLVTVLNYRWSYGRVLEFVEQLYVVLVYTPFDKANVARREKSNPYRATYESGEVHCGHNPWLRARRVSDLETVRRRDGMYELLWKEPPPRKRAA